MLLKSTPSCYYCSYYCYSFQINHFVLVHVGPSGSGIFCFLWLPLSRSLSQLSGGVGQSSLPSLSLHSSPGRCHPCAFCYLIVFSYFLVCVLTGFGTNLQVKKDSEWRGSLIHWARAGDPCVVRLM